jgi:hypothetical protein
MDALITAAALALASGDALGALKRVGLREDAPALALRGIAMAQLGDLVRAKSALKKAARVFGPREALARARCIVAEGELALVSHDLASRLACEGHQRSADDARSTRGSPECGSCTEYRGSASVLIGSLEEAERVLGEVDPGPLPAVDGGARAGHCGDCNPAAANEAGARCASSRRACRGPRRRRGVRKSRAPVSCCASPRRA